MLAVTGDVTDAEALLEPGGRVAVLRRPRPAPAPRWPEGPTAAASSTHAGNHGNDGTPRTYDAAHAVDGDPDTFWNDETLGAFPDTLTVTVPAPVELAGITVLSNSDGVPTDFTVEVWRDGAWVTAAAVADNDVIQRAVRFASPVTTDRVRITVTGVQDTAHGRSPASTRSGPHRSNRPTSPPSPSTSARSWSDTRGSGSPPPRPDRRACG